jgi:hypothetical protein
MPQESIEMMPEKTFPITIEKDVRMIKNKKQRIPWLSEFLHFFHINPE